MEEYTKGQDRVIKNLDKMFGKEYKEKSLISELRKIIPFDKCISKAKKSKLILAVEYVGMNFSIIFNKAGKTFSLEQIKYNNQY